MKKFLFATFVLFSIVSAVSAQEKLGVGWDDGISIKVPAGPVCVQLTGNFESLIPEDDDLDNETNAEIFGYVSYPFINIDSGKLNVFGGFGVIPTNASKEFDSVSYDKEIDFAFRLGIEPEKMITDHIGVSAKAGLQIYLNEGYDGYDDQGSTSVGTWGSVGMHWYF